MGLPLWASLPWQFLAWASGSLSSVGPGANRRLESDCTTGGLVVPRLRCDIHQLILRIIPGSLNRRSRAAISRHLSENKQKPPRACLSIRRWHAICDIRGGTASTRTVFRVPARRVRVRQDATRCNTKTVSSTQYLYVVLTRFLQRFHHSCRTIARCRRPAPCKLASSKILPALRRGGHLGTMKINDLTSLALIGRKLCPDRSTATDHPSPTTHPHPATMNLYTPPTPK